MRISKGALLIVLAFVVPFLVELRTVLVWFGVELTVHQTALLGLLVVSAILVWAFLPEARDGENPGSEGNASPSRDVTNGD